MSKPQTKDLLKFLKPFGAEITGKVMWLREFVWDLYPQANELIYDNYNALAFGWSPTDRVGHTFCSIAVGRTSKNIHFGFYWGSEIADPEKMLLGEGNQYRYILVKKIEDFPEDYIKGLMEDAFDNSMAKVKDPKMLLYGLTVTKSISAVKRTKKLKVKSGKRKATQARKKVVTRPKKKTTGSTNSKPKHSKRRPTPKPTARKKQLRKRKSN